MFSPEDFQVLDSALSDAVQRQSTILDRLKEKPNARQEVGLSIREREQLLRYYDRLRSVVSQTLKASARCCERCHQPSAARICGHCYAESRETATGLSSRRPASKRRFWYMMP
jgi:hypothetical protein